MKKLIKLLLATILPVILVSSCDSDNSRAEDVATKFLEQLYTCNFEEAKSLCTENGIKEMLWYSSNLTEKDVAIINVYPTIDITDTAIENDTATVTYHASNVIVCDKLEQEGEIGTKEATLQLVKQGTQWKVNRLEW